MAVSAKAVALGAELKDSLAKRFSSVTLTFDTTTGFEGAPLIRVGTAGAGAQTALIRVCDFARLGSDAIGLPARGYTPCVAQVVVEGSADDVDASLLESASQLAIFGELGFRSIRTELYITPNTTATAVSEIIADNLFATFDPDLKYKVQDSQ